MSDDTQPNNVVALSTKQQHQDCEVDARAQATADNHPSVFEVESNSPFYADSQDWELWMQYGLSRGWIGPSVCAIHDGLPTTEEEDAAFNEGDDPCIPVMRPYESAEHAAAVEANHPPSVWRK